MSTGFDKNFSEIKLDKLYYSIGEVCELLNIKPHILRYWENEIDALRPPKNTGGKRRYTPKDIALIIEIYRLIYEEKFTVTGANEKLQYLHKINLDNSKSIKLPETLSYKKKINFAYNKLSEILKILENRSNK